MTTEIKEIPKNFDHHILLYAKNWYAKSGNIVNDLKILLAEYSGLDIQHISDREMNQCLVDCFAKYCPKYAMGTAIMGMLNWDWMIFERTPQEIMIGKLAIAEGKYVDPTKILPVLKKTVDNTPAM